MTHYLDGAFGLPGSVRSCLWCGSDKTVQQSFELLHTNQAVLHHLNRGHRPGADGAWQVEGAGVSEGGLLGHDNLLQMTLSVPAPGLSGPAVTLPVAVWRLYKASAFGCSGSGGLGGAALTKSG